MHAKPGGCATPARSGATAPRTPSRWSPLRRPSATHWTTPVALLAWMADKFHAWTDPTSAPYGAVPVDRLLDNVMPHWIGVSGASAAQIYAESWGRVDKVSTVDVPAAVSVFPAEIEKIPRAWVEARYRQLVRWKVLDRGGHFPSLEAPDLFVDELRASFAGLISAPD